MKVLRISLLLLLLFSLTTAICYGQTAKEYFDKGIAYLNKGMFDQAITELKKALEIDPNLAEAYTTLGAAYAGKGMLDKAIAEFKKAIEINPNYAMAHNDLGIAYLDKGGMLNEAITEFQKAIEIDPNYAEAHNNLAVSYYYKGEYSLAIKHCDKLIELGYEVNPELLNFLELYREK